MVPCTGEYTYTLKSSVACLLRQTPMKVNRDLSWVSQCVRAHPTNGQDADQLVYNVIQLCFY